MRHNCRTGGRCTIFKHCENIASIKCTYKEIAQLKGYDEQRKIVESWDFVKIVRQHGQKTTLFLSQKIDA